MSDDAFQFDFAAMARRAQEMQAGLLEAQRNMDSLEARGFAGGGVVEATVSGQGRVVDLHVDPSVIELGDARSLVGLVMGAVNEALGELEARRVAMLSPLTDELAGFGDGVRREGAVVPRWPNRPEQ